MNPLNTSPQPHHDHTDSAEQAMQRRVMLAQDLESAESIDALLPVVERLNQWHTPAVHAATTAHLIDLLTTEMEHITPPVTASHRYELWNSRGVLLLRSQFKLVRFELWLASALVMLLGILVTLMTNSHNPSSAILPFVLVAPIVTAVGIAYVYSLTNESALELELAAPISPRLLALARITLVLGFNLILGIFGSLILAGFGSGLTLLPLLDAWLAPMALLSSLAFFLSVLFFDPLVSTTFSVVLWGIMTTRRYFTLDAAPLQRALETLPNLLAEDIRPLIWLAVVVMTAAALWLTGKEERWLYNKG